MWKRLSDRPVEHVIGSAKLRPHKASNGDEHKSLHHLCKSCDACFKRLLYIGDDETDVRASLWHKSVELHDSLHDLVKSAESGCHFCRLLLDEYRNGKKYSAGECTERTVKKKGVVVELVMNAKRPKHTGYGVEIRPHLKVSFKPKDNDTEMQSVERRFDYGGYAPFRITPRPR